MPYSYLARLWGINLKRPQLFMLIGAIGVAIVLAFALQDVIRKNIIIPLAYIWWVIGLYYRALPQAILWVGLVVIVLLMLLGSLSLRDLPTRPILRKAKVKRGQVEELAVSLDRARGGIYIKWLVAHRLGKLARDLLVQRGDRASEKVVGRLEGRDWQPSKPVDAYLEAGLNGSFSDYPNPAWPFGRPKPTPLDLNVSDAVEFLESQMENHDGR